MSLTTTTNLVSYTGNSTASSFSVPFRFLSQDDLVVVVADSSGNETTLTITTDYTVSGAGETTGTVTLVSASQAWLSGGNLATGYTMSIRRVVDLTQSTDIRNQGDFYPEVHEDAFDYAMMVDQQQQDELDRSLKIAETDNTSLDMTIPAAATRASKYLGFDSSGEPVALAAPANTTSVSTYGASLIVAASASAAQTVLGMSAYFKTLLAAATAAATRTLLGFDSSGNLPKTLMDTTTTSQPWEISNLSLACSVASSALTVSLKGQDGNNPSASNPVTISFRSSTATSGVYVQRQVTSATSVVVSSGSTLGHTSAKEAFIYVYAVDNGGTVELAVSSSRYDEGTLQSTTAEGGSGAADSVVGLYSTTARTSKAIRLIGRLRSTQATAGTWAAAPTEILSGQMMPKPRSMAVAKRSAGNVTIPDATVTTVVADTEIYDNNGCYDPSTGIFTADEEGLYEVGGTLAFSSTASFNGTTETARLGYDLNSGASTITIAGIIPPSSTGQCYVNGKSIIYLKKGDAVKMYMYQNSGANATLDGNAGGETYVWFYKLAV